MQGEMGRPPRLAGQRGDGLLEAVVGRVRRRRLQRLRDRERARQQQQRARQRPARTAEGKVKAITSTLQFKIKDINNY